LPKLILGVKFTDGPKVVGKRANRHPEPPPDRSGHHQKSAIPPRPCHMALATPWRGVGNAAAYIYYERLPAKSLKELGADYLQSCVALAVP
jgi:hypothetical protein